MIQVDAAFLWENVYLISIYLLLGFYFYFGIKFILEGRSFGKESPQYEYFMGLGLFFLSISLGEGIYLSDLTYRFYNEGQRIFFNLETWQSIVNYQFESIVNRDYYVVSFIFFLISMSF